MSNVNRGVKFAAFLAVMLVLAGCATAAPAAPAPTTTPTLTPQPTPTEVRTAKLTLAAGSFEADWQPLGAAIAAAVTETVPHVEMSVKDTASMMETIKLLVDGRVDLAFGYDYHVVLANQGQLAKAFPDAPSETIHIKCGVEMIRPAFPDYSQPARVLLPLDEQPLHLVTTKASGITGLDDLKGKHVSSGAPGSLTEELTGYLLAALAFDAGKDITVEQLSLTEAAAALDSGEIDAFFWAGPAVPNSDLADVFAAPGADWLLVPIAGNEAAQMMRAQPGIFHQSQIPASAYPNQSGDVETLAVTLVLAALEDLPADQVTQIVTSIKALSGPSPPLTFPQLGADAQPYLHPGSAAYFAQ